ncbi:MAG: molybdopterin-dependent oxidoreductase [Steroidobacteraceae bacterium]|nr:molybdopterin-dependent oxidoreductase [Steroidobacteraceae bacterium]
MSGSGSRVTRRAVLAGAAYGVGALVLGFRVGEVVAGTARRAIAPAVLHPHAFVRITPDGKVTAIIGPAEMGQGVFTALAMVLADELDADWNDVSAEASPADPAYGNPLFGGVQATNASTSIPVFYDSMRHAAAAARTMLVSAAATRWGVAPGTCRTSEGSVLGPDGRRFGYGELVEDAAKLTPPPRDALKFKDPSEFRIVGRSMPRLEGRAKATGQPLFGLDVDLPDMLTATVARKPLPNARARTYRRDAALRVPGVRAVVEVPSGIAVVAEHYWAALEGRRALEVEWDLSAAGELLSSAVIEDRYRTLARSPGALAARRGDTAREFARAEDVVECEYVLPYVAHAPMEPLNCTIHETPDGCDVWLGTQYQSLDKQVAAKALGVSPDRVRVRTQYLGGSFGRRGSPDGDVVKETAEIVAAVRALRAPIRNVWTREDDIRGGLYRPMALNRVRAVLGADGLPAAWAHTIVARSACEGSEFAFLVSNGVDETNVAGAKDLPYAVPNLSVDVHQPAFGPTVQWFRAVGNSGTCFAVESFIDELAHRVGRDPVQYRRALLAGDPKNSRLLRVLDLAAEAAGWGTALPRGRARGVAIQDYWGTKAAQVAEVEVEGDAVRVRRVTCAIDCGLVVNPDGVRAQVEGGILFALSAALYGEIVLEHGVAKQSNFDDYPLLRLDAAPAVDVILVPSQERPSGIGEAAVPHAAPAVFNAIFAATGRRLRRLPLAGSGMKA